MNQRNLSHRHLEDEVAGLVPERHAMSLVNLNLAAPINLAVAANVLSDDSVAYANAVQSVDIIQGI